MSAPLRVTDRQELFQTIQEALIVGRQAKETKLAKAKLKLVSRQYQEKKEEYDDLRAETIKVIHGTPRLGP